MWLLGYISYVAGTRLYYIGIYLAATLSKKAKQAIQGRKNILQKIKQQTESDNRKKIWFHCASLGEFEQARPLIEYIKTKHPEYSIVLTFFSPSGYEIRKNYKGADHIFYLPFDTSRNAQKFIQLINPVKVFFVKYEFWYFYLSTLHKQKTPVYLIAANFRKEQVFFKWYGTFFKKILQYFSHIFTQFENATQLLRQIGITQVTTSGDTRYDRVSENAQQVKPLPAIEAFKGNSFLLVAGSSYQPEEKIIATGLSHLHNLKVIVAPHEVNEERVRQILVTFTKYKTIRYSQIDHSNLDQYNVLIIDNVGMLNNVYQYADVAFVGGGFGKRGLHNILEPLVFGAHVLIGPEVNTNKFPEAHSALNAHVTSIVNNEIVLTEKLKELLYNPDKCRETALAAKTFINKQKGAKELIIKALTL